MFCPFQSIAADRSNNKFGMHLAQPHLSEFGKVAELVNSNGGDWGYVTVVMQENDRNKQKWQEIFDIMRKSHLIPIVRLATKPEGDQWRRPTKEDTGQWAEFLDSLNWVVKERYVLLFNEPNHGQEWGGETNPENYGTVALEFGKKLKQKNPDFFIMLAGFDASAPSSNPNYEDEEIFLRRMFSVSEMSEWETILSGWSSHSYPNPAFSGSVWDTGRKSIKAYEWELQLLKELGMKKNLPVFITETGWECRTLSRAVVATYFQQAFKDVWGPDTRVVAVTPFVFDYPAEPFLGFSWKNPDGGNFYPQYFRVQELAKTLGNPEQLEAGRATLRIPKELVENSSFSFNLKLKNLGQGIWEKNDGYSLQLNGFSNGEYFFSDLKQVMPFQETEVQLHMKTNSMGKITKKDRVTLSLYRYGKKVIDFESKDLSVVALPTLEFWVSLYPKQKAEGKGFEIQIFDSHENLIFKKSNLEVKNDFAQAGAIQNIALGEKYRIVILKDYYLPRQVLHTFIRGSNGVKFERMFPLDFNRDGALTWSDIGALIQNPGGLSLFIP